MLFTKDLFNLQASINSGDIVFKKIKHIFKNIRLNDFEIKIILVAVILVLIIQLVIFSKTKVVVVIDDETGETVTETRFHLSKAFIKQKIKNLSQEDKDWLKEEFGYGK